MQAVVVNELSKSYAPDKKALNRASFSLDEGQVFGFLGPNGAGKTTTVKLLCGMLSPTEGFCRVFDIDPTEHPERIHGFSGVITEHAQMYDNLTGYENLLFYGKVFGVDKAEGKKRALEFLERLDLQDARDKKLAAYSTGMRQRLSLARAMIHSPKILFLDEPTSGLDPESTQSVNRLIKSLAEDRGTTVFLCTHQLRYAQEICTCYGLIDKGEMLAVGDIDTLRGMVFSGLNVAVRTDKMPADIKAEKKEDGSYHIAVQDEAEIASTVKQIIDAGGNVYHVSAEKLSLEEIYFSLIETRNGKGGAR